MARRSVVGRRGEQPLVGVGGLGQPPRGFVQRAQLQQRIGHDRATG